LTNLDPDICRRLKEARRAAKISQIEVAKEIGCKQSALSMFEQGDGTKLNDVAIRKLAEKFGVDLSRNPKADVSADVAAAAPIRQAQRKGVGFCPNPKCPSNRAYDVEGSTRYLPDRAAADPVDGKFCAMCGELLMKACPNCGAPIHEGGFCSICGDPYVAVSWGNGRQ